MHAYRLLCVIWIIQLSIDRFVVIWMEHSQFSPGNRVSDTIDVYYRTFNVFWMKQTQSERLSWKSIKISWMIPLLKCELGNFTIKLHNVDKTTINVCCNSIIENRIIVVTPKIRMLDLIMTSIETRRPQSNLVKQLITVRNAQWSHRIEYRKVDITEIGNAISDNSINKLFHLVSLKTRRVLNWLKLVLTCSWRMIARCRAVFFFLSFTKSDNQADFVYRILWWNFSAVQQQIALSNIWLRHWIRKAWNIAI